MYKRKCAVVVITSYDSCKIINFISMKIGSIDLTCGKTEWYLQPAFYIKALLGTFSLTALIFTSVLESRLQDPYFPIACSPKPGRLVAALLIFFILTVCVMALFIFPVERLESIVLGKLSFKWIRIFSAVFLTVMTMIMVISYCYTYGSDKVEKEFHTQAVLHYVFHKNDPGAVWWAETTTCEEGKEGVEDCADYFDRRGTAAAVGLLAIYIPWFLLVAFFIYIEMGDDNKLDISYMKAPEETTYTYT